MKLTLATAILALVVCAQAKIVYLNGTEVYDEKHRSINLSTTEPSHKWITNFNARNISNHSGSNLRPSIGSVVRKTDNEEEPVIETVDESDGKNEESKNNMMSTRSAKQLSIFYTQRILNGLHLLALLAGIYLMIFVVEPVAVPQHYLSQHYYGLPWGESRTNSFQAQFSPTLQLVEKSVSKPIEIKSEVSSRKNFHDSMQKKNTSDNILPLASMHSPYRFFFSNYSYLNFPWQKSHNKSISHVHKPHAPHHFLLNSYNHDPSLQKNINHNLTLQKSQKSDSALQKMQNLDPLLQKKQSNRSSLQLLPPGRFIKKFNSTDVMQDVSLQKSQERRFSLQLAPGHNKRNTRDWYIWSAGGKENSEESGKVNPVRSIGEKNDTYTTKGIIKDNLYYSPLK